METAPPHSSSLHRHATDIADSAVTLEQFSSTIFKSLRRIDQRKCAHAYLGGLLAAPGKKTLRRIAAAISRDPSAVQSLRQFVSLSPWNFDDVMEEITDWVAHRHPVTLWSIGRTVLPKRGDKSVGVHRRFDLHSGRTLNCQLGLGSFLHVGAAQIPVDWSLYVPRAWTQDPERRHDARIPDSEQYLPTWAHALRLVDRLSARLDSPSAVVLADMSNEADVGYLVRGLAMRRRDVVVAVPPQLAVLPVGEASPGPVSAGSLLRGQGPEGDGLAPPDGSPRASGPPSVLVHLPAGSPGHSLGPAYRLFASGSDTGSTGRLWLTSLVHHSSAAVAATAARTSGTTAVLDALRQDFGLLDFAGRSFPGWYHHMALISAAYTFRDLHGAIAPAHRRPALRLP
ncbi:IS701 family transposase [Streptomyces galbus]